MSIVKLNEDQEWVNSWGDPTCGLRFRKQASNKVMLEQLWLIRGKTKVRREWRVVPIVEFDAPMSDDKAAEKAK